MRSILSLQGGYPKRRSIIATGFIIRGFDDSGESTQWRRHFYWWTLKLEVVIFLVTDEALSESAAKGLAHLLPRWKERTLFLTNRH